MAKSEFVESLMQLLNIFNSLIDSELKWNDNDNNDLIITVRSLMYIWARCGSSKLISCNEKIISIDLSLWIISKRGGARNNKVP